MVFSYKIWKGDYEQGKFKSKISLSGPSLGRSTKERRVWMLNIWKVIPLNHSGVFLANAPIPKPAHRRLQWGTWWEEYLIKLLGDMGLAEDSEDQAGQGFGVCRGSTGGHSRQHSRAKGQHTSQVSGTWERAGTVSLNHGQARGKHRSQENKVCPQKSHGKNSWERVGGVWCRVRKLLIKGSTPPTAEMHSPHKVWNLSLSSASVQAILPKSFMSYNLLI